jgi:DNA polymerase
MSPNLVFIDFETRSDVDLKKRGLLPYALGKYTEPLCLCWVRGDDEVVQSTTDFSRCPFGPDDIIVAHNAPFEMAIWNEILVRKFGWPELRPERVRCTMARAYAMDLPGNLEAAALSLGLPIRKDMEGRALMLKMCQPTGYDAQGAPIWFTGDLPRLIEYCKTDVLVEREIFRRTLSIDQELWSLDYKINRRGIPFDTKAIIAAQRLVEATKEDLNEEMREITGGAVARCSMVQALKTWLEGFGVFAPSLAKAELSDLLDTLADALPPQAIRALQLRREFNRSTSLAKLQAILDKAVGGRVHNAFQFHGATTGRWGGRGVQPHNFPRKLPKSADVEGIMFALVNGFPLDTDEPIALLSSCLRGFIQSPIGFVGGDFSNIEGRGLAWIAGEEWKLRVFREFDAGNGADPYCVTYSRSFGVPVESVDEEQRQVGKVQELSFGYQGGSGAVAKFSPSTKKELAEDWKVAWRAAHPATVQFWRDVQDAAIAAVESSNQVFCAGVPTRAVRFRKAGSFLWCRLPSGRALCYPYPEIRRSKFGTSQLTFRTVPSDMEWSAYCAAKEAGEENPTDILDDPANAKGFCRVSTYGGRLTENIVQAICADILGEAMLRLDRAGHPIALHIHDEIEVESDVLSVEEFSAIMAEPPVWAANFPIAVKCWRGPRYQKG